MSEELLKLEHLSIDYKVKGGYLSAVNDVNLKVNRGEILAIVGESGCGKSTVAHSIMNLLPGGNESVEGKIIFKGEDLRTFSWAEMEKIRGRHIGMIFQNPLDSLNPVYTTGKQVEEAILLDKVDKVVAWQKVCDLFNDVKADVAELLHKDPSGIEEALDLLMIAKYLERIGDHAVNIAEWVVYAITGLYKGEVLR